MMTMRQEIEIATTMSELKQIAAVELAFLEDSLQSQIHSRQ